MSYFRNLSSPRWPFRLNLRSPLADKLLFCAPLMEGVGIGDEFLPFARRLVLAGTDTGWRGDRLGIARYFIRTTTFTLKSNDNYELDHFPQYTVAGWLSNDEATNGVYWVLRWSQFASHHLRIWRNFASTLQCAIVEGGAEAVLNSTTAINDGRPYFFTFVRRGESNNELWINGILEAADNTTNTGSVAAAINVPFEIGGAIASQSWGGTLRSITVHTKDLSPAEIRALYDPATRWDLYTRPRTFVAVPAVAGAIYDQTKFRIYNDDGVGLGAHV